LCLILSYSSESTVLVTDIRKVDSEVNKTYLRKFFVFWMENSACTQLGFY